MKVIVKGHKCKGEISAIPSKSYAHRIAICSFLAGEVPSGKAGDFSSADIFATENCLMGLLKGERHLDCGESGSTLRFLIPLLSVIGGKYSLTGHGKLLSRPNDELFSALSSHGVKIVKEDDKIVIDGKLSGGKFYIRGDVSSQYISGLLMALPKLNEDSEIILTTELCSSPYVDITIEVLKLYGIKIDRLNQGFFIKGNQEYKGNAIPEGDWSNMAFFLVLGAINGDVTVTGLNLNSVQGDKEIINILQKANADIILSDSSVRVRKSDLKAFVLDAENCPDLVPIASVLASNCQGVSVIKNVERLKIKESDRIQTTLDTLSSFNIKAEYKDACIVIYGGVAKSGVANSFNDHRIAMSATVLASVCDGESTILDAKAVNKSYPSFYEDYKKVGGIVVEDV